MKQQEKKECMHCIVCKQEKKYGCSGYKNCEYFLEWFKREWQEIQKKFGKI